MQKRANGWRPPVTIRSMARGRSKRVIQRRLQDPLAQLLLQGEIGDGSKVKVSAGKHGLTINGQSFDVGEDVLAPEPPSHAIH